MKDLSRLASLVAFGSPLENQKLNITVGVAFDQKTLSLEYLCQGDLTGVKWPELKTDPTRQDNLWKQTCYEAFISWGNSPLYWELNVSPSGDWNLYSFDSYREGQALENRIEWIDIVDIQKSNHSQRMKLNLDLSPLLPLIKSSELCLGLSAILVREDHSQTFWALDHKGDQPDFHLKNSFLIKL